jgi:hypothetical protein
VLADGVLQHTTAFEGPQSFSVTLPKDVTCTSCTLQVLEFMSAEFGSSPNCFYHHCADIAISAPRAGTGGADGGAPKANASGDEGSCALSGRALSTRGLAWPMSALLLALAVVKRRQSAR